MCYESCYIYQEILEMGYPKSGLYYIFLFHDEIFALLKLSETIIDVIYSVLKLMSLGIRLPCFVVVQIERLFSPNLYMKNVSLNMLYDSNDQLKLHKTYFLFVSKCDPHNLSHGLFMLCLFVVEIFFDFHLILFTRVMVLPCMHLVM